VSALVLEPLLGDGFQAAATLEGTRLSVAFSGSGDMQAIALLADYLTRVHQEAVRHSVSEVRCDFRKLVFMNSSCFKSFVVWIDTLKNAPNAYRIEFLTDPNLHWQRRSLEALRRLAMNIVSITTDAVD
jgi:hypothetical protein